MLRIILIGILLSGCAMMPKHRVDVSAALREKPVNEVYIFQPVFPDKVKRSRPNDLQKMLPENQAESAKILHQLLCANIADKLMIHFGYLEYIGDESSVAWAEKIGEESARGCILLKTESYNLPVESVLIVGVVTYGYEDIQWILDTAFYGLGPWRVGKPKWTHTCRLIALLVRPQDGKILMSVEHEESLTAEQKNPALLDEATQKTIKIIADAIPAPSVE